jgi:hypothetical protein
MLSRSAAYQAQGLYDSKSPDSIPEKGWLGKERRRLKMRQALLIDGIFVGYPRWAYGGFPKADVYSVRMGSNDIPEKHLGKVIQTPLVLNINAVMNKLVSRWLSDSWSNGVVRKNCTIALLDPQSTHPTRSLLQWHLRDAYISGVEIPACDRSKEEPGGLTLTIVPGEIYYESGGEDVPSPTQPPKEVVWSLSNFRVEIGDLPCDRVTRIESFTWKQGFVEPDVDRVTSSPWVVDVPNLKLTIPFSDIQPWEQWHRQSVMEGRGTELSGCSIQLLSNDMQVVLARIGLEGVGIISFGIESKGTKINDIVDFQVELYCQQLSFGM